MRAMKTWNRSSYVLAVVTALSGMSLALLAGCPMAPPEPPDGGVGCTADADCDDSDACTTDTCDVATGDCDNLAVDPPVVVSASVSGDAVPGAALAAAAEVTICDGSTVQSYEWTQSNSVEVTISGGDTATATVTLPDTGIYKDELIMVLAEPPVTAAQLPPNVPLPEGEFPGGLQDRFQVVGINPFALEEAALVDVVATVTTSSGTYTGDVEIHTHLPWKPAAGIRNVPVGLAVLLHGKTQDTYDWALSAPAGSGATFTDAATQSPYFTPDVSGLYRVTVTDSAAAETVTLEIYGGTWEGAISGQDADGRPLSAGCTGCHDGGFAPDMFTPWAQTGHADIFTVNLNTSTHYSPSCFSCHTVGFDPDTDNGGLDDAADYGAFLDEFTTDGSHIHPAADNWDNALANTPATAQRGNIQCENCHGPNNGGAHFQGAPRIDISSDVCAVCHGEPLRHARFQQWQLSGHANYELAIDEGTSRNCSRCHTGNGFLAWLPVLLDDDPATDPTDSLDAITWAPDETHPQTCVVCHDPHSIGTTTGVGTDATIRISGDTPMLTGGFAVFGAGKGAICMTCHNSRRGLRNDDTFADTVGSDPTRAPHGSTQTEVLMGENAYFVEVGIRGAHSFVEDTCVNCHMTQTPPPDVLSYNQGGTNHTFFAGPDICAKCHEELGATGLQAAFEASADELEELIEEALLDVIAAQIAAGNTIDLIGEDASGEDVALATITNTGQIAGIAFTETHGRQAIAFTLTADPTLDEAFRMDDIHLIDGTGAKVGNLYTGVDERIIKAGWNLILAHNDGSHGVHNPTFVFDLLDAATDEMLDLAGE